MGLAIIIDRLWPRAAERIVPWSDAPLFSLLGPRLARSGLNLVNGRLIAIIDDDEALRTSLVDLMRALGNRAEAFDSGESFFASPGFLSFDCIIADIHMPGMSGLDLVRRFRERGGTTPVVLVTALSDRTLDDKARAAGAQCLLRKPFDNGALVDCIDGILSNERRPR
jgi:FixJ family two-component response regulator